MDLSKEGKGGGSNWGQRERGGHPEKGTPPCRKSSMGDLVMLERQTGTGGGKGDSTSQKTSRNRGIGRLAFDGGGLGMTRTLSC